MDDNPLGELCKGVVDISKCNILNRELSSGLAHVWPLKTGLLMPSVSASQ